MGLHFGLIGQPFWFWTSWKAEQWGIFAVSLPYGFAWRRGLWVHWISPREDSAAVGVVNLPPGR